MKKILGVLVIVFMTVFLIGLIGCGSVTPPPKPPAEKGKNIKFYQTGGDPVTASIVFNAQDIAITPSSTVYLFEMQSPGMKAVLTIDGVAQTTQLDMTEDTSGEDEAHCFTYANIGVASDGFGTEFFVNWAAVGKSRIKAECAEGIGYINVFTFDCLGGLGYNSGIRLESLNLKHLSPVRGECFIWADPEQQSYVLTGKSIIVGNTSNGTWRQDLYNIETVDTEALAANGIYNRKITDNRIYLAENPYVPGSYVKLCRPSMMGGYKIWDYTATTEFRR